MRIAASFQLRILVLGDGHHVVGAAQRPLAHEAPPFDEGGL